MKTHSLVENGFLAETLGESLGGLFHSARFFRLHAGEDGRFFEWTDGQRVLASVHFTPQSDGLWRSPARGTFAGYALADGAPIESLMAFHQAVEERLTHLGARRLEVLPPPMAHHPARFSEQVYALRGLGFRITRCDLNQSLPIRPEPLPLSHGNKQCLQKLRREGYTCAVLPPASLAKVFEITSTNRASKSYAVSMNLDQLQQMQDHFPEQFLLFGCMHEKELVAAAVCLRLDSSTLYVFDWAALPDHVRKSPVVMLTATMHSYCLEHGISTLDAGTSSIDTELNLGLMQFKSRMGLETSLKLRLEKEW